MLILKVPDSYYFCHTCFKLLVMLWYLNFFSEIASSVVPARGRGFDVVPPLRSSNSAKPARILGSWERKSRNKPKRHKSNGAGRSWSARGGDSGSAIPSGQLYNSQTRREPPSRNHQSYGTRQSVHRKICGDRNCLKLPGHITAPETPWTFFY